MAHNDAMPARLTASLAVLVAAALFGTTGTSLALLTPNAPGASVAAMRLLVGGGGLVVVALGRGQRRVLVRLWRRPLVWAMGGCVAAYQAFFFIGTARTGVALAALVALGVAPVLSGLFGWLVGEGAPGWVWAVSTAVAVSGLALLIGGSVTTGDGLGMVSAGVAGAAYAGYTVLGVRLTRAGQPAGTVLAASFSLAALLLLPALVTVGASAAWWWSGEGVIEVIWLGTMTTTVAYLLFGVGLRVLQPGHIATLTLIEPAVATGLAVMVLGEQLTVTGWVGCLVIGIALAVLAVSERGRADQEAIGTRRR